MKTRTARRVDKDIVHRYTLRVDLAIDLQVSGTLRDLLVEKAYSSAGYSRTDTGLRHESFIRKDGDNWLFEVKIIRRHWISRESQAS